MNNQEIQEKLKDAGLRPTPVRMMVYRLLDSSDSPMSSLDLETALETVDRSSISRTLASFSSAGIVHLIDDGSGATKYETCHAHNGEDDEHPHFHCISCGRTICFDHLPLPRLELPEGFTQSSVNLVVKGQCDRCAKKQI